MFNCNGVGEILGFGWMGVAQYSVFVCLGKLLSIGNGSPVDWVCRTEVALGGVTNNGGAMRTSSSHFSAFRFLYHCD